MENSFNPTIEQLMLSNFVRYNTLQELINYTMRNSNADTLNIFIDLYSLFKPLYSVDKLKYSNKSYHDITAFVLNMICHYRYFFKYIGVKTRFFIIFGLNCPNTNVKILPGYNSKFINDISTKKDTSNLIIDNLEMLDLLCTYIPDVYFFNIGRCEVSSMIYNIMDKSKYHQSKSNESMVITKDILPLQLVSIFDMRILRPSKKNNVDESFIVDNENLWSITFNQYRKTNMVVNSNLSNKLFSNFLAMTRVPERSMYSVLDIRKAYSILLDCKNMRLIEEDKTYSQNTINNIFGAVRPDSNINTSAIDLRWKCINPEFQCKYVLSTESPSNVNPILRYVEDNRALVDILNRYFERNHIDLNRLV